MRVGNYENNKLSKRWFRNKIEITFKQNRWWKAIYLL